MALIMRQLLLFIALSTLGACATTPLPAVNPQQAWIDFSTPTPGAKMLMAERLDNQKLSDGRFFQVTPGRHELMVRFDFEVPGGGGLGSMTQPLERLCYMSLDYDHFTAGERYVLEGRSLMFTPNLRLFNAKRELLAEERTYHCIP